MKKILFIISSLSLLFLSSCNEDDKNDIGKTAFLFTKGASSQLAVGIDESYIDIEIGVTTKSGSDRQVSLFVDTASTADPNSYTIDTSSLVIPAGEYTTNVRIYANFDNIPETGEVQLILNFGEESVVAGNGVHTISLFRYCLSDLAGMYSVTTNYIVHDFLPDFSSHTMVAEVSAVPGQENKYSIVDFSGGLYVVGPYTQYAGVVGSNLTMVFDVACDKVTWTNLTDPWQDIVADPEGVNSYDPNTGIITISWTGVTYGERAVSVYTPL